MTLNPEHTKNFRRHLRNNMTETEIRLWSRLKGKQILGYKVRRQYGIGNYVVDFYCPRLKLAIEVDGESHYTRKGKEHDKKRDSFIRDERIEIIRIPAPEIYDNLDGIVRHLRNIFEKRDEHWKSNHTCPLHHKERKDSKIMQKSR